MIAYAFRFLNDDNEPTSWHGIAFAKNKSQLFLEIDIYGDPYRSEIKTIQNGSCCFEFTEEDGAFNHEIETDIFYSGKWKKPDWKKDV